ncbi:MAG: hypothetical protein DWQ35_12230 [Planctomycetota bacterium]|nr:MAG: hypothetical protein DWQ35_12230 [Planctomycetota bacterium]REK18121.1 MAG: hypothetical protein DWQ42_20835 [Planctomycetota bacterium]REK44210.1 MAG: hypothetical protein DWQ46_10510 [Planctomycetota bacterium]
MAREIGSDRREDRGTATVRWFLGLRAPLVVAIASIGVALAARPILAQHPEPGLLSDSPAFRDAAVHEMPLSRAANASGNPLGEREALIQSLAAVDPPQRKQRLYELSFAPERSRRLLALELLAREEPDPALRARVSALAATDADPIVRGHARLLASDWDLFAVPPAHAAPSWQPPVPTTPQFPVAPASFESAADVAAAPTPPWQPKFEPASLLLDFQPPADAFAAVPPFWEAAAGDADSLPADVTAPERSPFRSASQAQPGILDRPLEVPTEQPSQVIDEWADTILVQPFDAPLGYSGPSGILPSETQWNSHFVPVEDRWRQGFPDWDRYDRGFPLGEDYPYKLGRLLDPYNQNVLKGDYPILGQHTFLNLTAISLQNTEYRQVPTATTPFESTDNPFEEPFFGTPDQFFYTHYVKFIVDLFHGNEAFKPVDWRVLIEPVFNVNHLQVAELAVVNPDVRRGKQRTRTDYALEQWFVELKLADLGPDYDFLSARAGQQLFVSDFRGFVFKDINRGVRLFGTRFSNRDQFNVIWLDQVEKETNSELNTFDDRHQNTVIANYFRQDFIFPGYTGLLSFHYNRDQPSFLFDRNDFLVRPDPAGVALPHEVEAYYLGLGGDGHIGRINVSNQFYFVFGEDSINPIATEAQDIFASMAAVELSYDRDWIRFRTSYFYASGDDNPDDTRAGGFDTILDDPIFAGGEFSYWQRQAVRLFGVNLVQRKSIVPNLRSSKIQGQSNFVNPGLQLINFGMDFEVTPELRVITNANYMWFDNVAVLRNFTFQGDIGRDIGTDLSVGLEWRPLLNDNIIIVAGSAVLIPARGLKDIYGSEVPEAVADLTGMESEIPHFQSHFVELALTY